MKLVCPILFFVFLLTGCDNNGFLKVERYGDGALKSTRAPSPIDTLDIVCKEYYPSGNVSFEYYEKNGKVHGPAYEFHENGSRSSEGIWSHGKKQGYFKYFDPSGSLRKVIEFIDFMDTSISKPNQIISIGRNGDTLINDESIYYEFWSLKDTVKYGKEEYDFKVVLKSPQFRHATMYVGSFDERFNAKEGGHINKIEMEGFETRVRMSAVLQVPGKNTLRGFINNYDIFKDKNGADSVRAVQICFSHDFYALD